MPSFKAEIDQMVSLAGRLSGVKTAIQHEGNASVDSSALGEPAAIEALQDFLSSWTNGRHDIVARIDALRTDLARVTDNYRRTDEAMAARLQPERP